MLTPIQISQLTAEDRAIEEQIGKLIARRGQIAVELQQDKAERAAAEPTKHEVRYVNTSNLHDTDTDVELHGADCQHVKRYTRRPEFKMGVAEIGDPEKWTSAKAFAEDYNEAFYDEDGIEGCWGITVYPCTGMVAKKTTITGY